MLFSYAINALILRIFHHKITERNAFLNLIIHRMRLIKVTKRKHTFSSSRLWHWFLILTIIIFIYFIKLNPLSWQFQLELFKQSSFFTLFFYNALQLFTHLRHITYPKQPQFSSKYHDILSVFQYLSASLIIPAYSCKLNSFFLSTLW